jgi:hypothetical protein
MILMRYCKKYKKYIFIYLKEKNTFKTIYKLHLISVLASSRVFFFLKKEGIIWEDQIIGKVISPQCVAIAFYA